MHLYLIRHAQSANNDLYFRTGASTGRHADPPLTELGHRQAQRLAQFLAATPDNLGDSQPSPVADFAARHDRRGFDLTHLYCSLMIRSIQTGSYVAEATGLPLAAWPEFHERGGLHNLDEETGQDVGVAGPDRAWFATEYPHLIVPEALGEMSWWNRPPETQAETVPRARRVWSELVARHGETDDRVAVISHIGFFQSLMTALFSEGDTLSAPNLGVVDISFGMSNTSVSRVELAGGRVVIRYLNRVDFLPDELITG